MAPAQPGLSAERRKYVGAGAVAVLLRLGTLHALCARAKAIEAQLPRSLLERAAGTRPWTSHRGRPRDGPDGDAKEEEEEDEAQYTVTIHDLAQEQDALQATGGFTSMGFAILHPALSGDRFSQEEFKAAMRRMDAAGAISSFARSSGGWRKLGIAWAACGTAAESRAEPGGGRRLAAGSDAGGPQEPLPMVAEVQGLVACAWGCRRTAAPTPLGLALVGARAEDLVALAGAGPAARLPGHW